MRRIGLHTDGVKVFGAPRFELNGTFERVPPELYDAMPLLRDWHLGKRCPGARVAFNTNSRKVTVHIDFEKISADVGMSIFACQSANVYIGSRQTAPLAGLVVPPASYAEAWEERTFDKSDEAQDVTVWLPRNEVIKDIWFEVEDDATVTAPEPYKYPVPVVFYGSSITEGGCCSRLTNAYNAIISRRLDMDYINMGFSGSAKGETEMADYLCTLKMSALVMDYDYNAPDAEHLRRTHEPFFKRIREKLPDLPILMLSCPNPEYRDSGDERRAIVRATYENAVAAGDKHVWYIDGITLFGDKDRDMCITDCTHPTDLGFYRMAEVIEPVIKEMLESQA